MRDSRPLLLDTLFDDANLLRDIQQRAIALIKLNKAVKALLPKQMHGLCRVANYRQGILVLEVANASWLTRLRYEQQMLLSTLRSEILPSLVSINIKINPKLSTNGQTAEDLVHRYTAAHQNEEMPVRQLSEQSAQRIKELAERSSGKLREKLERLAALAGERVTSTTSRNKK
ncbi:MAG: DciA family protein [Enterobacteriaceae bacterium]|nr:DciA family protein [Enterobacteriaceae bacterium]